jgi:hypothetical protein
MHNKAWVIKAQILSSGLQIKILPVFYTKRATLNVLLFFVYLMAHIK